MHAERKLIVIIIMIIVHTVRLYCVAPALIVFVYVCLVSRHTIP